MTKAQILYLARNINLMDKLNTISGLMEINPNDSLIESLPDKAQKLKIVKCLILDMFIIN